MTRIMSWNLDKFDKNKIELPEDFVTAQKAIKDGLAFDQNGKAKDFVQALWNGFSDHFQLTVPQNNDGITQQKLKDQIKNICQYCSDYKKKVSDVMLRSGRASNSKFIFPVVLVMMKQQYPDINDQSQIDNYLEKLLDVIESLVTNPDKRRLFMIVSRVIKAYVDNAPGGKITDTYLANNLDAEIIPAKQFVNSIIPTSGPDAICTILRTIQRVEPDVFIVIEVVDSDQPKGNFPSRYNVLEGVGGDGAMQLLNGLRCCTSEKLRRYCMVPPVRLGGTPKDKEGIAVYYDSQALEFLGPWEWTDKDKAAAPGTAGVTVTDYPPLYANALPDTEKQRAGQGKFKDGNKEIPFDPEGDGDGSVFRTPFLTQFKERTGTQRTLNILSVHNQWENRNASFFNTQGVKAIKKIKEMTSQLGTAVGVVIGDFNLPGGEEQNGRETFEALEPYQLLIDVKQQSSPLVQTHLYKWKIEKGFSEILKGNYPTYDYWGTWVDFLRARGDGGLDNALVQNVDNPRAIILNPFTGVTWNSATQLGYSGKFIGATVADPNTFPSMLPDQTITSANNNLDKLDNLIQQIKDNLMNALQSIVAVSNHLPIVIEV